MVYGRDCSPRKGIRELGSHRREADDIKSIVGERVVCNVMSNRMKTVKMDLGSDE